jgi:phosphoribosylanthranilate isomerase
MREDTDLSEIAAHYSSASALLLDTYQPGIPGGTGKTFDWSLIRRINKPIILAGGLDVTNVREAIHQVQPYAVDVSGGVESDKGIKSHDKISTFMREVANA